MKFKPGKWFIVIAAGVIVVLLANNGARKIYQRYWELNTLGDQLRQAQKENVLLRKEIYFLENDPSYIEKMARRELGLVSKGEIEYRFKKQ